MRFVNNNYKMNKPNEEKITAEKIQNNFSTLLEEGKYQEVVDMIKLNRSHFQFRIIPIIDQQKKS